MPELMEQSYIGVRFFAGERVHRGFVPLATMTEAHDWAQRAVALGATMAPPRFLSFQFQIAPDFDGLSRPEVAGDSDLTDQRARVWHRPTAKFGSLPVRGSRPQRPARQRSRARAMKSDIKDGRPTQSGFARSH